MYNSDTPLRAELPSSKQLLRSTILAAIAALVLLIAVVLPAEYGIDPTGAGGAGGLPVWFFPRLERSGRKCLSWV